MKKRAEIVARLKREAWSLRDIAEVFDLSHQRVGQVSRSRGRFRRRPVATSK
jgi:lambda repressor-like predicted transcriptional regulator